MDPWHTLDIAPTNDTRAIKKAYSIKLKTTRPDEDAEAYQRLREAYEAAQWWGQHGLVGLKAVNIAAITEPAEPITDNDSATVAQETQTLQIVSGQLVEAFTDVSNAQPVQPSATEPAVDPAESSPFLVPGPSVEHLLQTCATLLEQEGATQIARMWPALQRQLEDLPIAVHQEASRGFAALVVQKNAPVMVLIALTRHFQWGLDYRVDTQLGHDLSLTLQSTLQEAHVYAALNAPTDPGYIWAMALAKLFDQKRTFGPHMLAMCMNHSIRQQVAGTSPMRLSALGATVSAGQSAVAAAALGGVWQALLLQLLFILAAHELYVLTHPNRVLADWRSIGFLTASLLGLYSCGYFALPNLGGWWRYLRHKLHDRSRLLYVLVLTPWVFAGLSTCVLREEDLNSLYVLLPVSLTYFAIWLVVPTDEQAWRTLFLPTCCLLLVGLAVLFPELNQMVLLSLAFGWALAAHLALSQFNSWFESLYQDFVKLRILRERPYLIIGIKIIGAVWLLCVLICLPVFLFRLCARQGILFGQSALVSGAMLSFALHPLSAGSWLLAYTLAAVFAIQWMEWGLQKCADFALRKLQS